jgi:hypothetical protein
MGKIRSIDASRARAATDSTNAETPSNAEG